MQNMVHKLRLESMASRLVAWNLCLYEVDEVAHQVELSYVGTPFALAVRL